MKNMKIATTGLLLVAVLGGGGFVLGESVQSSSTTTTTKPVNNTEGDSGAPGQWGVYSVDDFFFGGSSKTIQIGLQCISTKQAAIPDTGTKSVPGGPASLWTQLTQEEYGLPSDMHILHLAVVSPCDSNWAYVANWQNPNDTNFGFQNDRGPAHYFNGKWIIGAGTAGQWQGVPDPIRKSFGITFPTG